MRSGPDCSNADPGMTAMRYRSSLEQPRCHEFCSRFIYHRAKSEVPALCVGHQEVSKNLDARNRLEFFGINKEGIKRERIGFAK